jgi:hypothetical protein
MSRLPTNVPQPEDRMTIICLYCEKPQEISRRAVSVTCKFCHKSLKVVHEPIKNYQGRTSVDTLDVLTIEKKGHLVATEKILVGGLVVRGKVKGKIISRGPVLVGPEAEIRGDVKAPTIAVGAGAILDGYYEIGKWDKVGEWLRSKPPEV